VDREGRLWDAEASDARRLKEGMAMPPVERPKKNRKRKPAGGAPKGNQNAKGHVGAWGGGRPTIYNDRMPAIIQALRERGLIESEIAKVLNVSPTR
jgi:uncharacterized protein YjcR